MDSWDEIKTAYQVARAGTVSGAADKLGVHHATVIRHIDALEGRLGVKLFQRHARGYTPTEAGQDLLRVAHTTDEQFQQLTSRIKGQGDAVVGDLVITTIDTLAPVLVPVLTEYQQAYPDVCVRLMTDARVFRLEYGEAHVALRAGSRPQQPDNVVQPFLHQALALVASTSYRDRYGLPEDEADLLNHRFIGHTDDEIRAPFNQWLVRTVGPERITFRVTESRAGRDAIRSGAGIGFIPRIEARSDPDLHEVIPSKEEWSAPLWLVTHVDLHRTAKVQSFLRFLKDHAKDLQE